MEPAGKSAEQLRRRIAEAEDELKALRQQLAQLESAEEKTEGKEISQSISERQAPERRKTGAPVKPSEQAEPAAWKWPLSKEEYERYGRQLILPQVGINGMILLKHLRNLVDCLYFYCKRVSNGDTGQKRLKASRVLVIGAGGLGCPAAAYLAGAGVGTLGVVDGDVVEASNLHRQIAHSTARVGVSKVTSLVAYCKEYVLSISHADTFHMLIQDEMLIFSQAQSACDLCPPCRTSDTD